MEPILVKIPERKPDPMRGQIVSAFVEAGVDPRNAGVARNVMVIELLRRWGRGESTRETFIHSMKNMLVLNPSWKINANQPS